jgi:hypothetical protein
MCTSPHASQGIQFRRISLPTLTGSGTLFGRSSFSVPLPDASKSFFFFPMVLRRWWWEWRCGRWRNDAGGLLSAWETMPLKAAQKPSRRPPVRSQKRQS